MLLFLLGLLRLLSKLLSKHGVDTSNCSCEQSLLGLAVSTVLLIRRCLYFFFVVAFPS